MIVKLGDGYQDIAFPITVSYPNDGQPLVTDTIVGRTLDKDPRQLDRHRPTEVKITLNPMYILVNGLTPFKGLMR